MQIYTRSRLIASLSISKIHAGDYKLIKGKKENMYNLFSNLRLKLHQINGVCCYK